MKSHQSYFARAGLRKPPLFKTPLLNEVGAVKRKRFAEEFLIDLDPRAAARRAGLASDLGPKLLGRKETRAQVKALMDRRSTMTEILGEEILRRIYAAWDVDYNEFVENRVSCCPFCWGLDHHRQYSLEEIHQKREEHLERQLRITPENQRVSFDESAYEVWDKRREPMRGPPHYDEDDANSEESCPQCAGGGTPLVVLKDTRFLSPGARYIYQGVEVTDRRVKLDLRPRAELEDLLVRHQGLIPRERRQEDDDAIDRMTEEECDAVLAEHGATLITDVEYETVDVPGAEAPGGAPGAEGEPEKAPTRG